jgi:hypothetical protein
LRLRENYRIALKRTSVCAEGVREDIAMTTLSLHRETAIQQSDSLPFERREVDRWSTLAAATAFCLGGERFGEMHDLSVLDYSDDGLGAICDTVIPPGEVVSIGFQSPGLIARRGVVLRCQPCGQGYRVAIRFESRMAA